MIYEKENPTLFVNEDDLEESLDEEPQEEEEEELE